MDASLEGVRELLGSDEAKEFALGSDDVLRFKGRVCVLEDAEVKRMIDIVVVRRSNYHYLTLATSILPN